MLDSYLSWIKNQQENLDSIFATAANKYYQENKDAENFAYDAIKTKNECFLLGSNKDLCYDRFTIGLSYSMWYQGKRTNAFISYLAKLLYDSREEPEITILDLGAGTGAVHIAIAICQQSLIQTFSKCPIISVINIDTSPFMLDYNRKYLWPTFIDHYNKAVNINSVYTVNSWENSDVKSYTNFWVTASYLFDQSDNVEHLTSNLSSLVKDLQPRYIICNTSKNKGYLLKNPAIKIKEFDYDIINSVVKPLFTGSLPKVNAVRALINKELGVGYSGNVLWKENWITSVILQLKTPDLILTSPNRPVNLFTPPLTVRRDVVLSEEQDKAAKDDGRPTIIYGPAGCGKTVVITERIINIVKNHRDKPLKDLSILVTTFNKGLIEVLKKWLGELFKREKIVFNFSGDLCFLKNSKTVNVRIMHFDTLPYRIWQEFSPNDFSLHPEDVKLDYYHLEVAKKAIDNIKKQENITNTSFDNILNPSYIVDEYNYIVFGQDYTTWDEYSTSVRRGRTNLEYGGRSRKLLFSTVLEYLSILEKNGTNSFITRRHKFLKNIKNGKISNIFSHLIVDEFQDCTQTDYKIFFGLLKTPNNLIIAGDFAQAVHLGSVSDVPRERNDDERMRNWNRIQLNGSYRLPYRISECLQKFSENIVSSKEELNNPLSPFKGAPPGARPIVVYSKLSSTMAEKVENIVNKYNCYDILDFNIIPYDNILILEKDKELQNALLKRKQGLGYVATILRVKGLEKKCVLWSTRINIDFSDKIRHYVYTILTRTSGVLIIALFGDECEEYKSIINEFNPDRLIIWDKETNTYLNENYQLSEI